jgi:hypothetical protein
MLDRFTARWPPTIKNRPARARRYATGAATVTPLLLIGMLSCGHPGAPADIAYPGAPADIGLAGCTSLSATHRLDVIDYPKIRAQFAGSRWPDLRTAGTAYVDLVVQLRTARGTDGYQTVWFYQRLSAACARHGAPNVPVPRPRQRPGARGAVAAPPGHTLGRT